MENKPSLMPTAYFLIMLIFSIILHFLFPIQKIIPFPFNLSGIIPLIFGIYLNIWTDALFKKRETAVKPHEKPECLICEGPFRISRHPMYLGMVASLIGVDIILASLTPFITPVIFIIYMESIFIPLEEDILEREFGEEYREYRRNVRRWC